MLADPLDYFGTFIPVLCSQHFHSICTFICDNKSKVSLNLRRLIRIAVWVCPKMSTQCLLNPNGPLPHKNGSSNSPIVVDRSDALLSVTGP